MKHSSLHRITLILSPKNRAFPFLLLLSLLAVNSLPCHCLAEAPKLKSKVTRDDHIATNLRSELSPGISPRHRGTAHHLDTSELQLDTAETAILNGKKDGKFLGFYRSLIYSKYFQDSVRADSWADLESQGLAEEILTYQTSKTLRWLVENSSIADLYERLAATYNKYTTASFERKVDGSVGLGDSSSKKSKLFQLKLHASSSNGIEPRLIIDDQVTLRYDLLHQQALLEYQINF